MLPQQTIAGGHLLLGRDPPLDVEPASRAGVDVPAGCARRRSRRSTPDSPARALMPLVSLHVPPAVMRGGCAGSSPSARLVSTTKHLGAANGPQARRQRSDPGNRAAKKRMQEQGRGFHCPALPMTPGEAAEQKANDGHARTKMGKLTCGTPCTSARWRHSLISLTATARLFFGHCWPREHRRVGRLPRACVCGSAVGLRGCEIAPGLVG